MACACGSSEFSTSRSARSASRERGQQGRGGPSPVGIEPEIQWAVGLVGEAPGRIIELHRRDAQIRQHEVQRAARLGKPAGDAGEVHAPDHQNVLGEAKPAQSRLGPGQLQGVHVDAEEAPARQEARQNLLSVPPEAQGRIQADISGPRIQDLQNLPNADGSVRARRRVASCTNLLQFPRMALGVQFLVSLRVTAGMGAPVAHPAPPALDLVTHAPIVLPSEMDLARRVLPPTFPSRPHPRIRAGLASPRERPLVWTGEVRHRGRAYRGAYSMSTANAPSGWAHRWTGISAGERT